MPINRSWDQQTVVSLNNELVLAIIIIKNKLCKTVNEFLKVKKSQTRASLVAQWLRIRLPMQGTRVRALVQEDPTCRGATKSVRHNY